MISVRLLDTARQRPQVEGTTARFVIQASHGLLARTPYTLLGEGPTPFAAVANARYRGNGELLDAYLWGGVPLDLPRGTEP